MSGLKVCGITRRSDLLDCDALGVDAVGINLWPGSKRGVSPEEAAALLRGTTGGKRVGVFVERTPSEVAAIAKALKLDAIQPHGDASPEPYAALGIPWVWVVRGTPPLETLRVPEPLPCWVLLDAAVPGYGGAGARTDWGWAARAVQALRPLPVWLAGGITVDNIEDALVQVAPAGIDVASGSETVGATRGEKDRTRIEAMLRAVRATPESAC
jgi:phosphoribosylanthranilate isomerase